MQPCKIELKLPACCPRCGFDLRVTSTTTTTTDEPVEPDSPVTMALKETAKRLAQKCSSRENDNVPAEIVKLPTSPEDGPKLETPPPPPPSISEPIVMDLTQELDLPELHQRAHQYYGLLPTPTQMTFTPQIQQVGQLNFNPPPIIWSSQQQQQQFNTCYQAGFRPPPPPILVQQPQPVPPPRFFQYPAPVNFPFPPPSLASFQPGQGFQQGNGVYSVQHHFLNVLPPGQLQQQYSQQ